MNKNLIKFDIEKYKMMKKTLNISAIILVVALIGCKPDVTPIGDYYPAGDGLIGSWVLDQVTLTDLSLPIPEEDDPTYFYNKFATHWKFTFNADSTYSVDEKGPGPDIFGDNGTWTFTNYPYPEGVVLYSTDTISIDLKNMPRANDMFFGLEFTRNGCDKNYIKYTYNLKRKNN